MRHTSPNERGSLYSPTMHVRELLIETTTHVPPSRAIENVSADEAVRRFSGVSHSMAEILAHMVFWQEWFRRRCEGVGEPIPQKAAEGWPEVHRDTWPALRSRFIDDLERFVKMEQCSSPGPDHHPSTNHGPVAASFGRFDLVEELDGVWIGKCRQYPRALQIRRRKVSP
jgi:DinB superfamily